MQLQRSRRRAEPPSQQRRPVLPQALPPCRGRRRRRRGRRSARSAGRPVGRACRGAARRPHPPRHRRKRTAPPQRRLTVPQRPCGSLRWQLRSNLRLVLPQCGHRRRTVPVKESAASRPPPPPLRQHKGQVCGSTRLLVLSQHRASSRKGLPRLLLPSMQRWPPLQTRSQQRRSTRSHTASAARVAAAVVPAAATAVAGDRGAVPAAAARAGAAAAEAAIRAPVKARLRSRRAR